MDNEKYVPSILDIQEIRANRGEREQQIQGMRRVSTHTHVMVSNLKDRLIYDEKVASNPIFGRRLRRPVTPARIMWQVQEYSDKAAEVGCFFFLFVSLNE